MTEDSDFVTVTKRKTTSICALVPTRKRNCGLAFFVTNVANSSSYL